MHMSQAACATGAHRSNRRYGCKWVYSGNARGRSQEAVEVLASHYMKRKEGKEKQGLS